MTPRLYNIFLSGLALEECCLCKNYAYKSNIIIIIYHTNVFISQKKNQHTKMDFIYSSPFAGYSDRLFINTLEFLIKLRNFWERGTV